MYIEELKHKAWYFMCSVVAMNAEKALGDVRAVVADDKLKGLNNAEKFDVYVRMLANGELELINTIKGVGIMPALDEPKPKPEFMELIGEYQKFKREQETRNRGDKAPAGSKKEVRRGNKFQKSRR